jgi:transcriptional regulator with XRE-family HTH domain
MERLREIREVRGLSQRALAAKAGVDLVTVNHTETGAKGKQPRLSTLQKLAAALDVEVDDLLEPPYSEMSLEELAAKGKQIRKGMVEATETGDMLRMDLLLRRGEKISEEIKRKDPPLASIRYTPDKDPVVTYLREPTEEEEAELKRKLGTFTVNKDLLKIG